MLSTLEEIRDNIAFTSRETQIDTRIDEYINLVLNEINDFHPWSFLRRKYTLSTVDSQEDYQLRRDVDKIGLIRTTQAKLIHVPDHLFYKWVPNPTAETTYPNYYRLWEDYGVEIQISTAEKIDIVSDDTADTETVTIVGTDASGYEIVEEYTLSGTTQQAGTKTFTTIRQVSKSGETVGNIEVDGNTSGTVFVTLLPEERSPRFKRISFYPIPSADDTSVYIEYFTRLRELVNDQDVPAIDRKWHYLLREGGLAKVYQYQNKENSYIASMRIFMDGLRRMQKEDLLNIDYIPMLKDTYPKLYAGIRELSDTIIGTSGMVPWW
jgi:hypothetical protein